MSWLARLDVGAEVAFNERIFDSYAWHKKAWECYPGIPEAEREFLSRIDQLEGAFRLWLLSRRKPSQPPWCPPEAFSLNQISPSFLSHRCYAFDLKANPVKTRVQRGSDGETLLRKDGKRKCGKRVPLVDLDELRTWLIKKGAARCRDIRTGLDVPGGFRIMEDVPLEISRMTECHFRKGRQTGYHGGVRFRGVLEVTDFDKFVDTYYSGIGSAKSFGFGLLLLAPVTL